MELKQIKETIKTSKLYYNHDSNIDYKGIAYYLIKNYMFSKSIKDITNNDIDILLDNLVINSELITSDNIDDYDYMIDKKSKKYLDIKDDKKMVLLNFYDINDYLVNCNITLNVGYKW